MATGASATRGATVAKSAALKPAGAATPVRAPLSSCHDICKYGARREPDEAAGDSSGPAERRRRSAAPGIKIRSLSSRRRSSMGFIPSVRVNHDDDGEDELSSVDGVRSPRTAELAVPPAAHSSGEAHVRHPEGKASEAHETVRASEPVTVRASALGAARSTAKVAGTAATGAAADRPIGTTGKGSAKKAAPATTRSTAADRPSGDTGKVSTKRTTAAATAANAMKRMTAPLFGQKKQTKEPSKNNARETPPPLPLPAVSKTGSRRLRPARSTATGLEPRQDRAQNGDSGSNAAAKPRFGRTGSRGILLRRSSTRKGAGAAAGNPGATVVLRHQKTVKRATLGLYNDMIQEASSQIVKTKRSKVKALVTAFETVFALQSGRKPAAAPSENAA